MGFSQENGYVPVSIESIMSAIMAEINVQFNTSYTMESFVGTNYYKYFYALAQRVSENEVKTSEIFAKLTQYFAITNEMISRPVITNPGLIDKFADEGYTASVKKMIEADAGKIHICVNVDDDADDYEDVRLDICTIIKDSTVAGTVTIGTEEESIVLSNGQEFDFKFNLPAITEPLLRLTITLSENNQGVIGSTDESKTTLMANIAADYSLGKNFEPQRYFSIEDAPWAETVLLEWSDDAGANWHPEVFEADYDDLFVIDLANISIVES